jgi:hypothetical protein
MNPLVKYHDSQLNLFTVLQSDFLERLTFSADLPASLNPAMHISNIITLAPNDPASASPTASAPSLSGAAHADPSASVLSLHHSSSTVTFNPSHTSKYAQAASASSTSATASTAALLSGDGAAATAASAAAASSSSTGAAGETRNARALRHGRAIRECLHAHSQTVSFLCDLASNLIDLQVGINEPRLSCKTKILIWSNALCSP